MARWVPSWSAQPGLGIHIPPGVAERRPDLVARARDLEARNAALWARPDMDRLRRLVGAYELPRGVIDAEWNRFLKLPDDWIRALASGRRLKGDYYRREMLDWDTIDRAVRTLEAIPRSLMEQVKIPVELWLDWWPEWFGRPYPDWRAVEGFTDNVAVLLRAGLPFALWRAWLDNGNWNGFDTVNHVGRDVERLYNGVKRGWFRFLIPMLAKIPGSPEGLPESMEPAQEVWMALDNAGANWRSAVPMNVILGRTSPADWVAEKEQSAKRTMIARGRGADRRAQHYPESVIREYPEAYEQGRKLGPLMREAIEYLRGIARTNPLVFHGRDAEMLHKLAERAGVHGSYVITPRALTLHFEQSEGLVQPDRMAYMAYLRRLIPANAVHVDTGYEGNVPKWCTRVGLPVADVKMLYHMTWDPVTKSYPWQIPFTPAVLPTCDLDDFRGQLHRMIDDLVEEGHHRFVQVKNMARWQSPGAVVYSDTDAPAFWAQLYGACDALGLPRTVRVGPGGRTLGAMPTAPRLPRPVGYGTWLKRGWR